MEVPGWHPPAPHFLAAKLGEHHAKGGSGLKQGLQVLKIT